MSMTVPDQVCGGFSAQSQFSSFFFTYKGINIFSKYKKRYKNGPEKNVGMAGYGNLLT